MVAAKIVEDIFARSKGIENAKALGAPRRTASFAIVDRYDDSDVEYICRIGLFPYFDAIIDVIYPFYELFLIVSF